MNLPEAPISYLEFSFFRSVFLTITAQMMMSQYDIKMRDVPKDCVNILIFRCLVGVTTFIITTISLKMLPLSIYQLILSTNPFFTAIL